MIHITLLIVERRYYSGQQQATKIWPYLQDIRTEMGFSVTNQMTT